MHPADRDRTVYMPRTIPVQSMDDVRAHHWTLGDRGNLVLTRGAPPREVLAATNDFIDGKADLDGYLDRLGVPRT